MTDRRSSRIQSAGTQAGPGARRLGAEEVTMHASPLIEPDRFFAGPRGHQRTEDDAQTNAVERLVMRCERLRPHLRTVDALEAFVAQLPDPTRVRRRISLALALEQPPDQAAAEGAYGGFTGRAELEAFRSLAQRRTAAVVWVFC